MKLFGKSILGIASVAALLGLTAASASAQHASFTLPVKAQWGRVALAPGDYTVRFPTAAAPTRVIEISGNGKTMWFVPQVMAFERAPIEVGKLTLVDVDGTYAVRSITDVGGDRTFSFFLPKSHEGANNSALKHQTQAKIAVAIKKVSR